MKHKVLKIAEKFHAGQKRRDGKDYVEHPKRVAYMLSKITDDPILLCVSYLHDTYEATRKHNPSKVGELEKEILALGDTLLENVKLLSKPEGVEYNDYISKISKDPYLLMIKFCDIIDNLTDNPTEKQKEKYLSALKLVFEGIFVKRI